MAPQVQSNPRSEPCHVAKHQHNMPNLAFNNVFKGNESHPHARADGDELLQLAALEVELLAEAWQVLRQHKHAAAVRLHLYHFTLHVLEIACKLMTFFLRFVKCLTRRWHFLIVTVRWASRTRGYHHSPPQPPRRNVLEVTCGHHSNLFKCLSNRRPDSVSKPCGVTRQSCWHVTAC